MTTSVFLIFLGGDAVAQKKNSGLKKRESNYYTITSIPAPKGVVMEGASIELMPDGVLAVCTRRGQIWTIDNADRVPAETPNWTLFAEYLHEPLSLTWRDGWLYAVQRPEVTRMQDIDGDGRADIFESVSDDWGINGNYHEYNFGSRFDRDGYLWVALCLTGSFTSESPFRGWMMRVGTNGETIPTASGVRSPGGVGLNLEGEVFYTDNQGAWNGSSSLKWVPPGSFQGNPNGNIWYEYTNGEAGERPADPPYSGKDNRVVTQLEKIENFVPPAVVMPHKRVGNSPTAIEPDSTDGKFGPFAGQLFVGEQTHSKINRVYLEKVKGGYQGAVFPFMEGFGSGNIAVRISPEGKLYTSGSNRGWGARGGKPAAFERVDWTGETPFEIHTMQALKDGFRLTFTKPFEPSSATADAFTMEAYTYIYHKGYGSPEVDQVTPSVTVSSVARDGLSIELKVEPLTRGHVHQLEISGLKSAETGQSLLHPAAYYTLNEIPD